MSGTRAPGTVKARQSVITYWAFCPDGRRVRIRYREPKLPYSRKASPKRGRKLQENPYSMTKTVTDDDVFQRRWSNAQSLITTTAVYDGAGNPTVDYRWTANHDLQLLGRLRNRVAGSGFNAGVALGESREALRMITNAASRIYNGYRAARRGNFARAADILTAGRPRTNLPSRNRVANNWLELQYGWLPLLGDVKAGAEFLAHQHSFPIQHRVKARLKIATGTITNKTWYSHRDYQVRREKSIVAILKEKDVVALSGLTDPWSVAWELLPYSFVFDWFIPVGNYLQARGLSQALTGTFVSTDFKTYDTGTLVPDSGLSGMLVVGDVVYRQRHVSVTRTVSTTLPVPLPTSVGLGEALSWRRAANAVALLTNLVPRRG